MASSFLGNTARRATRRAIFVEDEGLASLAHMETDFSGNRNALFSTRRPSYRAFPSLSTTAAAATAFSSSSSSSSSSSLRSGLVYQGTHHFLDSCSLCKKPLSGNRDIFMYRGNTPFCSEKCRQEQMDIDEAEEKWSLSMKAASRKEQQQKTSSTKAKNHDLHVRAGTVVAG